MDQISCKLKENNGWFQGIIENEIYNTIGNITEKTQILEQQNGWIFVGYYSVIDFCKPAFNNEVQKGRGLNPSPVATKTCIVCLPQKQNAGASPWKGIPQKSRKSIHI